MSSRKFACPACEATLQVAATLPSGKKIRCPKCGEVFVPLTEEASARGTSIQARKRAAPLLDEDEDEEQARPAVRKKPRKAQKKPRSPLPWLIGGAVVLLVGVGVALAIVFWPSKNNEPVASSGAPQNGPGTPAPKQDNQPVATGRRVFDANGCARCHQTGSMGRGRGPNLAKVGADPSHTVEWFTAFIRNPRSVRPNARMQGFEGRIKPDDLQQLAEYLTTLK
jgi:mono/diheme cytochrome c family protein